MLDSSHLKEIYRALDFDRPLDYRETADRALYVPNLHGDSVNPINELLVSIQAAERPASWLFTGHRGVGKSTELRWLAAQLDPAEFFVGVVDVADYLNLHEAISTEKLLLALAGALADVADQRLGGQRLERSYLQRFRHFLLETQIDVAELAGKAGELDNAKMVLRQIPSLQQRIAAATSGVTARLADQVRKFVQQVVADVKARQGDQTQVLLILDSLEKLRVTGSDASVCYDGIRQTFDINGEFLKLEHIHVLYSVPPYLPFLMPLIGSYFGVEVYSLPHVKVFETPTDRQTIQPALPCQAGLDLMLQTVRNRYSGIEQIIPRPKLEQLALASSGSLRNFFRLIRSACTKIAAMNLAVPLTDDAPITLAQQVLRNEMPLAEDDKLWLTKVRVNHGTGLQNIDRLPELARLFDNGLILNYRNGSDWCDVHYLLHDQLTTPLPVA